VVQARQGGDGEKKGRKNSQIRRENNKAYSKKKKNTGIHTKRKRKTKREKGVLQGADGNPGEGSTEGTTNKGVGEKGKTGIED